MLTRPVGRTRLGIALVLALAAVAAVLGAAGPAAADLVHADQMWVLNAVSAPAAWRISRGRGVTVAVIDSGVKATVSDLAGSVTAGPNLTGVHTSSSNPNWGVHGTWMASLIAGHGHGVDSGIFGTAPAAHILSIRVITDRSDPGFAKYQAEPLSRGQRELAKAIRYAVARHVGVISMSLGYSMASRQVRAALQAALSHGVVVVASSGNSGSSTAAHGRGHAPYSFPADYPGVLGVGAVNRSGKPARFSSANLSVQVAAPGVNVPAQGNDGQYWLVSGTSPACALTAGVAALIKSRYPGLPPALVVRAITSSTRNRPPGGYDDQVGFGTVDAVAALTAAGRLFAQRPPGRGVRAARHFGGGPRAIPPPPVRPRGAGELLLLALLGVGCLVVVVAAIRRLVSYRGDVAAAQPPGRAPRLASAPRRDTAGDDQARAAADRRPASGPGRFSWQANPAGRHAAQSDRRGGDGGRAE
jgi:subtilisin family serine protease